MADKKRSLILHLAFLLLITLIVRGVGFLPLETINYDGVLYIQMAKLFHEGYYAGIHGTYFNLYPLMISLVQKVIGDWELSGRLISFLFGSLTVIPIFLLGRSLFDEKVGWISALFYITVPNFIEYGTEVVRDPILWFFLAFTLWLVWEGLKRNRWVFFGLGSCGAGLGALTRVEGFILWGLLATYVAFQRSTAISWRRRVVNVLLLIFLFPLLISPALVLLISKESRHVAIGEMLIFSSKVVAVHAGEVLQPRDPIKRMDRENYEALPSISKDALELARRHRFILGISEVIHKFIKSANLMIVLVLLGLWTRKKEGFTSPDWFLLYIFAGLFTMSVLYAGQIFYFSTRHGLTLVMPLLFVAAFGVLFLVDKVRGEMNRLNLRWVVAEKNLLCIVMLIFVSLFLVQGLTGGKIGRMHSREIGLWLKENGYQGSVIMGQKRFVRVAFYADGTFLEIPDSWEKVMDSIRQNGVKVLIVDTSTIGQKGRGFFKKWSDAGFIPLRVPKEKKEQDTVQIFAVP